jgi:UMF1 family MFS transporter
VSELAPASTRSRRAIWSWAFFDFANSPFTTLVVTFVYATYFTQAIADDPITGTALWSRAITITAVVVALFSPVLGALADRGGYRKRFVLLSAGLCIAGTAGLYFVEPGHVISALVLVVIANIAFEFATVFYNAFLPDISPPGRIGTISGMGWGLGFFGGLLALAFALVAFVNPEQPWFGFSREAGENIRATNLLVAAWFLLFSLPFVLWVREDKSRISQPGAVVRQSLEQLRNTFVQVRKYREIVRFLVARLFFNDGLVTIFAFGGIYAAETFGFTLERVLVFGIVINLAAGVGAIAMGYLDDHVGAKATILVSLVGLVTATIIAVVATQDWAFWTAGVLIGIFSGPNQSASRSLMARFVPRQFENEFFGFFAFSGKLTAFLGPFLLGVLTQASGSQRVGVAVVLLLFVIGFVIMLTVDERAGCAVRDNRLSSEPQAGRGSV